MSENADANNQNQNPNERFLIGLARAFGGAILFSLPIFMTMEMWQLGFYIDRFRLALFIAVFIPLLLGLSYYDGFEDTNSLAEDAIDVFVACAVGFVASALVLLLFNVINFRMSVDEIVGKISIQAILAAVGALVAQTQLGGKNDDSESNGDDGEDTDDTKKLCREVISANWS